MTSINITGGVSPLKKRGKSSGKYRRGKSAGKRAGGTVIGDTRYKRDPWEKPAGGDTTYTPSAPPAAKPYKIDDDGKVVMNDPWATKKWTDPVEGETTTEKTLKKSKSGVEITTSKAFQEKEGRKPTYDEAWDLNIENVQDKYKDKQDYKDKETARKKAGEEGATEKEIEESIYDTKTVTRTETTPGYWTYYDEDGGEISKEEYSKYKNKR